MSDTLRDLMDDILRGDLSEEERELKKKKIFEIFDESMKAQTNPPHYTPDGLPTGIVSVDINGNSVPYADPKFRMEINEGSDPDNQVAPVQAGFEKQDYAAYEKLLALKAAGKWDRWKANL